MELDALERLERTTLEMVVQALRDYQAHAVTIFREETDKAQDIAEDVMREAVEAMGVPGFQERLYGKADYKKALYVFVPEAQPVALMLDAKAEKGNGSATIQMSQTSMRVRYMGTHGPVDEPGKLSTTIASKGRILQVVSIITKYLYADLNQGYALKEIIVACIPNGALQDRYNPTPHETIWRAGRHSPQRGEEFRVRLNYAKLQEKATWRIHRLSP